MRTAAPGWWNDDGFFCASMAQNGPTRSKLTSFADAISNIRHQPRLVRYDPFIAASQRRLQDLKPARPMASRGMHALSHYCFGGTDAANGWFRCTSSVCVGYANSILSAAKRSKISKLIRC